MDTKFFCINGIIKSSEKLVKLINSYYNRVMVIIQIIQENYNHCMLISNKKKIDNINEEFKKAMKIIQKTKNRENNIEEIIYYHSTTE